MAGASSAHEFSKKLSKLAHAAAGKEPAPPAQKPAVPLVPIFVGIDRAEHEQLRETFLYRLGDEGWSVKPATSRLLLETGLPGGNTERVVEEMIKAGLKPYADWQDPGRPQLVKLQFYVRLGQQVFRDEVLWDVSNPVNGAEPYSVRVCADLGLGCDWFDAIRAHVQQRLDEVKQDLREAPQEVELQPPVKQIRRTPAAAAAAGGSSRPGVPRLQQYDPTQDVEAARLAARQQKLQERQQRLAAALAKQQAYQQQQQQQVKPGATSHMQQQPQQQQQQQQQPSLLQQQQQQQGQQLRSPRQLKADQLQPPVAQQQQLQLPQQPQLQLPQQLQQPQQPQMLAQQPQQMGQQQQQAQALQLPAHSHLSQQQVQVSQQLQVPNSQGLQLPQVALHSPAGTQLQPPQLHPQGQLPSQLQAAQLLAQQPQMQLQGQQQLLPHQR